jgi:hypothetical protein
MQVQVSERPGGRGIDNADRVVVAPFGVVVLDGASAFEPVDVEPGTYADTLSKSIAALLYRDPAMTIADAVAESIERTTEKLSIAVLRARADAVDLYVLGDSPIHYGVDHRTHQLVDDRLSTIAEPQREHYLAQLRAGHGYNDAHKAALAELQRAQRRARNVEGGYWIAETDPAAAHHGLTVTVDRSAIEWAVLATDGAADFIEHAGPAWHDIATFDTLQLSALMDRIHEWEDKVDPDGRRLPRAKRHDDKSIAAIASVWD